MTVQRAYLDYNATAPLRPEAHDAMVAIAGIDGNPSSVHADGRVARALIEDARAQIAVVLGVEASDLVFTSGGSESAATILAPGMVRQNNNAPIVRLLIGATEHDCVLKGHRFADADVETIPVDGNGLINIENIVNGVSAIANDNGPASVMIAVQAANNETGVIQPLKQIQDAVADTEAILVTDAVQWLGRYSSKMSELPGDAVIVSSHKIGGPKGIGALALRRPGLDIDPLIKGGGQEHRRRAGTENPVAIVGFAAALKAAEAARETEQTRVRALRDHLEAGIRENTPQAIIIGDTASRLNNTSCIAISGLSAETAVISFDLDGISVSAGSACSSGKVGASHVLEAMGLGGEKTAGAIRVSLGYGTTEDEIERFLESWTRITNSMIERRRGAA